MRRTRNILRWIRASCPVVALLAPVFQGCSHESEWEALAEEASKLYEAGQYDRPTVLARKALEVAERNFGPDHPAVATSLNNLAELYRSQGQYALAAPLYQRALAITEKALGPEHPDVATTLEKMAALYLKTGRATEAKELGKRAAVIRAIKR